MEDYEAQEQEFWRKLEESEMSRSQMLKRSVADAKMRALVQGRDRFEGKGRS